jgi:hypothetical protein
MCAANGCRKYAPARILRFVPSFFEKRFAQKLMRGEEN